MSNEAADGTGSARPVPGAPGPVQAADLLATAMAGLGLLAALGETVEDEWTYVTNLAEMGRARLRAAMPDPARLASPEIADAIEALAAEAARISDPHRAIDWLSTFPACVDLAMGGSGAIAPTRPPAGGS